MIRLDLVCPSIQVFSLLKPTSLCHACIAKSYQVLKHTEIDIRLKRSARSGTLHRSRLPVPVSRGQTRELTSSDQPTDSEIRTPLRFDLASPEKSHTHKIQENEEKSLIRRGGGQVRPWRKNICDSLCSKRQFCSELHTIGERLRARDT